MSRINDKTPGSGMEPPIARAEAEILAVPVSADWIYRIAAMAAGIVFLATLL